MGDEVTRIKTFNTGMRQGPASNIIDIEMKKLEDKYNFHSRMFTFVHGPENVDVERAWGWIFVDIVKIKKIVNEDKNILFGVLSIEMHMGSKIKKKAKNNDDEVAACETPEFKETKGKFLNLKGYPHVHLTVYRTSDGKLENFNDLHSKFREETSFGQTSGDISITGGSDTKNPNRLKTSNTGLLSYVLKNTRHIEPYDKLKIAYERYKKYLTGVESIDCSILIDNSDDKDVIDFFKKLNTKNIIVKIPKEKMEISDSKEKVPTAVHGKNGTRGITASQEDLINASVYVLNNMKKRGFKLCDGQVYGRKKNTRRTWELWGTIEKFIRDLITLDDPKIYCILTKNIDLLIKNAKGEGQRIFPTLEINWFYIEFKDFFLHLPSCVIYREITEDIHCGLYNSDVTLKKLYDGDMKPSDWLNLINNQDFGKDPEHAERFKSHYYSVLLPLIQKAYVLCLQGVANSGKTTLLEPLRRLFPKYVQTEITKGQFSYSGLSGKRLIALDDVESIILQQGNIKQLIEGGFKQITMESKNVNAVIDIYPGNIVISTNMDGLPTSWYILSDENVLKEEYQARLAIYFFKTPIKKPRAGYVQTISEEEIGKVIIECAKSYARTMLGRDVGKEIIISETFEEGEKMRAESEKIYTPRKN
jgi:hypothetical protein